MTVDRASPEQAHARVDAHEQVCAERYGSINQQLIMLRSQLDAQTTDFHARLNTLSNRMWAAATGAIGMLVIGLAALVFALLMKGRP